MSTCRHVSLEVFFALASVRCFLFLDIVFSIKQKGRPTRPFLVGVVVRRVGIVQLSKADDCGYDGEDSPPRSASAFSAYSGAAVDRVCVAVGRDSRSTSYEADE